jgi:hypothetical protein
MVKVRCDDCGSPAIGRFDITYYRVEAGREVEDEVSKIVRGRALCETHLDARGDRAKPSKATKQTEERVLPEVPPEDPKEEFDPPAPPDLPSGKH